jgi:hypothetical protein
MSEIRSLNAELDRLRSLASASNAVTLGEISNIWKATHSIESAVDAVNSLCDTPPQFSDEVFSPTRRIVTDLISECTFRMIDGGRNLLTPSRLTGAAREAADRGLAALARHEQQFGETCSTLYFKACSEIWKENFEIGYALFDRLRMSYSQLYPALIHQQGCYSVRELGEIARLATLDVDTSYSATFLIRNKAYNVVIACFDESYLRRFGPRLTASLAPYNNVTLHFHVATNDPGRIKDQVPSSINLSFEPEPLVQQRNAYYASMRFIRMQEFIDAYKAPLLFTDADVFFEKNPETLFQHHAAMHVGLNYNQGFPSHVPWRRINAQQVYVDGGPESCLFARYLRNLFGNIYARTAVHNWWIDQAILWHAVLVARINGDRIRFINNEWGRYSGFKHQR